MRHIAILLLLTGITFAQANVTLDKAIQIVYSENFSQPGLEYLDSTPKSEVFTDSTPFWVVEVISAGSIVVMVPVNGKTGRIDTSDYMEDILKTHYLANFLEKSGSIKSFLTETRSFADTTQGSLDAKDSEYRNVLKPQLNRTFAKESAYLSALNAAEQRAAELSATIGSIEGLIAEIKRPSDIFELRASFTELFAKERAFLDAMEDAMDASDALKGEMLASGLAAENPSLYQALFNSISIAGREKLPGMRTTLGDNEREIGAFFSDLGSRGKEFLVKLRERASRTVSEQERKGIEASLNAYTANYTYINANSEKVNSTAKIGELYKFLTQSKNALDAGDYAAAKANFTKIDSLVSELAAEIAAYKPPEPAKPPAPGINWLLIAALAIILIALLLYKFKDRIFGGGEGKIERKEITPYWGYRA